jgi:predicted nucleic acid-binding protein
MKGDVIERFFLDTNIVVYCFDNTDTRKQETAKELLTYAVTSRMGVVSSQVLQEFCNVASNSKRLNLEITRTMDYVNLILQPLHKIVTTPTLLGNALTIRKERQYSFYDSLILAAALEAGCTTLYSEDMQHGQTIASIRIVNPFLITANEIA